MTVGPVKGFFVFAQRNTPTGSDNHNRIVQFARITQCIEHAVDLVIDIACRPAIFPCKCLLIAVVNVSAIERNPREPAVIFLCVVAQPVDPLRGGLLVGLGAYARHREI
ncbi:Uncharacterised protein [Shigella sonnei]|nr:Uncharacterised protein [Shigella sonnei]CSP77894.1 Uncharacterised protein [Shigella sonnei]